MKEFKELGLSEGIVNILARAGFKTPTDIQKKAIPLALEGKDIIGGSATGSGKTLVFASPIIEKLVPNRRVQALILTPTRELAEQVACAIREFSANKNINTVAIYGGVDIMGQMRKLGSADVVVGTPGRILDHLQRRSLRLGDVKFLVLDEVDRMFDMGFHRDVEKIISNCPQQRQTMMFSATISSEIDYLSRKYTKDAIEVAVESYVNHTKLKQIYYDVDHKMKFSLLVHLLKKEKDSMIMVFCSTRRNVDFVTFNIKNFNINAMAIHGGLSQNKRIAVLKSFHERGIGVLVCTDVAARGLDIKEVSHVYNYDLPPTSNEYIHRIGRTARAGKEGKAVNLLCNKDYKNFKIICEDENLEILPEELPKFEMVNINTNFNDREYRDNRGNSGNGDGHPFKRRFHKTAPGRNRPPRRKPHSSGRRKEGFGNRSRSFGRR
ncbi:MAG: DEAD/DEAH box helicase [Candidatus Pacearchaeota archaeon]